MMHSWVLGACIFVLAMRLLIILLTRLLYNVFGRLARETANLIFLQAW